MRWVIVILLLCLAAAANASPLDFSGTFYEGEIPGCCYHGIQIDGSDGFALHAALPDGPETVSSCNTAPCDFSGTFDVIAFADTGWYTSFDGMSVGDPLYYTPGYVGGGINYQLPVVASPCPPPDYYCTLALPTTLSGEIWARYEDGTYLYDLAVSGTGTLNAYVQRTGPTSYLLMGYSANVTGTASPIPEPATLTLSMFGAAVLMWAGVRQRRRERSF